MINLILKKSFDFNVKENTNVRKNLLFCKLIRFLKILTSNIYTLDKIGSLILEELELHFFIDKLLLIYVTKIKDNTDLLYLGKVH